MTLAELRKQALKSLGRPPRVSARKLKEWIASAQPTSSYYLTPKGVRYFVKRLKKKEAMKGGKR